MEEDITSPRLQQKDIITSPLLFTKNVSKFLLYLVDQVFTILTFEPIKMMRDPLSKGATQKLWSAWLDVPEAVVAAVAVELRPPKAAVAVELRPPKRGWSSCCSC
ncbi:unnamed protein product [Amaranthus hypochondriacus]